MRSWRGRTMRWDPSFFRKSPLFWPIAPAASRLEPFAAWPTIDELSRALEGALPVRLEPSAPKPRRGRTPEAARYDARIANAGAVPTRARSWHDLLNALVWATFPRAKRALHARQHRMIAARVGADLRLPGARTKEQDAVAMLDEGGVVILRARAAAAPPEASDDLAPLVAVGAASALIFGHAIYEGLACGWRETVRAAAYVVDVDAIDVDPRARVAIADDALAALLARDAPIGRGDFGSIVVDERLAPPPAIDRPG